MSRAGCTQTYLDVERMIDKIVNKFVSKWGGEHDDFIGPAHEAYIRAYNGFDPSQSQFTTFTWHCVTNALKSFVRARSQRRVREIRGSDEKYAETPDSPRPCGKKAGGLRFTSTFDADRFAFDLSEDAATVCRLLWGEDVESVERLNGTARQTMLMDLRGKLWDLGWGMHRITESFSEIREALK